jgi:hypothetical protein
LHSTSLQEGIPELAANAVLLLELQEHIMADSTIADV